MKDRILDALARARAGYSELRLRRVWSSTVLVRGRAVESAGSSLETGGLARSCSPGAGWGTVGFSGAAHFDALLLQSHELSLAGASRQPVRLAPIPIRQVESSAPLADDPREVPQLARQERAERLAGALLDSDRRLVSGRILVRDEVVETWLGTSEGTWIHDLRAQATLAVLAIARLDGSTERALGSLGSVGAAGRPSFDADAGLVGKVGSRAVERLHAVPVRPGRYPVVLDPAAAGALIHRAVAHIARPALPGADPDVLPMGTRLGPEILTVGDDPTAPGLIAGSLHDDEGTVARRCTIIQNGVVLGHLHSRETAGATGQAPTGHARAGGLRAPPYPRPTNTFVVPGTGTWEDLLEGVSLGVYVEDALACEASEAGIALRAGAARMIRNGRFAEPVKGVNLAGDLLEVLGCVDAVAGDFRWDPGTSHCCDGVAGIVTVTTGAPHLRLDGAEIEGEVG